VNAQLDAFKDRINRVSPYGELRNIACDADSQKVLYHNEWMRGMNIVRSRSSKRFH
jgi:hypothetical protein